MILIIDMVMMAMIVTDTNFMVGMMLRSVRGMFAMFSMLINLSQPRCHSLNYLSGGCPHQQKIHLYKVQKVMVKIAKYLVLHCTIYLLELHLNRYCGNTMTLL